MKYLLACTLLAALSGFALSAPGAGTAPKDSVACQQLGKSLVDQLMLDAGVNCVQPNIEALLAIHGFTEENQRAIQNGLDEATANTVSGLHAIVDCYCVGDTSGMMDHIVKTSQFMSMYGDLVLAQCVNDAQTESAVGYFMAGYTCAIDRGNFYLGSFLGQN